MDRLILHGGSPPLLTTGTNDRVSPIGATTSGLHHGPSDPEGGPELPCAAVDEATIGTGGSVVVGVDFADRTEAVVAEGLRLAAATGSELLLVHAAAGEPELAGYDHDTPEIESGTRDDRAVQLSEEHGRLRELAEHAATGAPGVEVRPLVAVGPTAATLLRVASERGATHVVVGSHGHGGLHHLLVGSVAEDLLRHAPVPVVVVPVRSS